jgi:hypothetical protein
MAIGIGLGCAEFPFSGASAYWRWIDMCEAGGVDSIWQTDRIVSRHPFLEWMTTMADFDFSGAFYKLKGAAIAPKPVQPDLPMWIGGSTDAAIRRTARIGTGWQAGGEPPADAGRVVAAIKAAATKAGRLIDEDHYGAGFAFHFGSRDAPVVGRAMDAYAKRTGRDAQRRRSRSATPRRFSRASPNTSTLACRSSFCGPWAATTRPSWPKPVC